MTLAWHFTAERLRDGRAIPAIGETLFHEGVLEPCANGLHASERIIDALYYAPGPIVHRVRLGGEMIAHDGDKLCARERTILWSHTCSDNLLRSFARQQARSVLHLWDAPEIVRRYLETGDESIRAAAGAAAWDAAWAAAGDPARAAARAAAWAAAGTAAGAAARDAAWDAAWDAANQELQRLILEAANQPLDPEQQAP